MRSYSTVSQVKWTSNVVPLLRTSTFFTVTSCELILPISTILLEHPVLQDLVSKFVKGLYKRRGGIISFFAECMMAHFANMSELLRMRKAYAGWDTLTFGQQSYQGQPMAISPAGADTEGTRVVLYSQTHEQFAFCLDSVCLLMPGPFVI